MDLLDRRSSVIDADRDANDRASLRVAGVPTVPGQRWALATAANLAVEHDMYLDTLATGRTSAAVATLLSAEWGISTRLEALQVCDWLARSGHRKEFDKAIENRAGVDLHHEADARQAITELRTAGVFETDFVPAAAVWDSARIVHVSRCAFDLGFLDEHEAWDNIDAATTPLIGRYRSWAELSANYVLAWRMWRPTDSALPCRIAERAALLSSPRSPWSTTPWQ
jgi:hypothetical protein